MRVVPPNAPNRLHLSRVREEMQRRRRPTIRVYWCVEHELAYALEGSHRLAAAASLGVAPKLKRMSLDDRMRHDFSDLKNPCTVREVVRYLWSDPIDLTYEVDETPRRGGRRR